MSGPRLEIEPYNCPRSTISRGGATALSPMEAVRCGYHQPGVHEIEGGTVSLHLGLGRSVGCP